MRTRLTLHPGQKGTKRLLAQYGDQLVCVRYRYDAVRQRRLKTVELVVSERPWVYCKPFRSTVPRGPVLVAVHYRDRLLRLEVQQAGGIWKPDAGAWELPYHEAERLGIEGLVVVPGRGGRAGRRAKGAAGVPRGTPPYTSTCREGFSAYACIESAQ